MINRVSGGVWQRGEYIIYGQSNFESVSMSKNTKEYRTLLKAWDNLARGMQFNIIELSQKLCSEGLISTEELEDDPQVSSGEKASRLISQIAREIERDPVNYHTLVRILAKDKDMFREILECLGFEFHAEDDVAGDEDTSEDHSSASSVNGTG